MKLVEKFISIDGEGPTAGALSVFLRFAGCNLHCVWCDTCYAQKEYSYTEDLSVAQIVDYVRSTGVKHVTITGGEPLLQKDLRELLSALDFVTIHIETNGSINIEPYRMGRHVNFVVDYKLPGSKMEHLMCLENFTAVKPNDAYKFVIADAKDMEKAVALVKENNLINKTQVFFSTVFGEISPADVVEVMKRENMNGVRLQLQLHKFIWDKNKRGV